MSYEVDFLPVGEGSGDAIVIRYGDDVNGYSLHVVDGGRAATAETIFTHINAFYPGYHINHMVLSHADDDHATGQNIRNDLLNKIQPTSLRYCPRDKPRYCRETRKLQIP